MDSAFESKHSIVKLPRHFIIEPTNMCNFSCIMCPNKYYTSEQIGMMSLDLFERILNQIKDYALCIQLYWMGEPLLCNEIIRMIKKCKATSAAKVVLSTNGSLLDYKTSAQIIASKLDTIIISLDALHSQETYSSIRCGGNLAETMRNVKQFLRMNANIDARLQMIAFTMNEQDRLALTEEFNGYSYKNTEVWLDTWAGQFPELEQLSNNISPVKGIPRKPCSDLWYKMAVHWDGRVSICCHDWNWHAVVGDLNKQSVSEIWNGKSMERYRAAHILGEYKRINFCAGCTEWATPDEYSEFI